jgi:threonylcarbamoyladenosine tRNA methylthiotransferase MtaB
MRVHLQTLGCRLNEAELAVWGEGFVADGHQLVADAGSADLVVVNTCAVTQEAVRKSRKLIRRAQNRNPGAKLVVSGCYASLDAEAAAFGIDLLVPNQDKDRLVEITRERLDLHAMPQAATAPDAQQLLAHGRQRAFIKVQDGCRYRCSFCVVTLARGEEHSRPAEEIVAEVQRLQERGVKEVVLAGVHLGGYGSELGSSLHRMVAKVLAETDIPRLRLGSLEPWELGSEFWELFADPRLLPHLHLPLQSGSDSVLRRMSRRCRKADFTSLVKHARDRVADLNLTTDIIVGFPGESPAEWAETLAFVEEIGFGHVHIFTYSPRPGTKAAGMPDQVATATKRERSRELHRLAQEMKRAILERYLGRRVPVLIEDQDPVGRWGGYTPNFLRVNLPDATEPALGNQIRAVRLDALDAAGETLHAHLL